MVINTLLARPVQSLEGLILLVLGLPAYWYWTRTTNNLTTNNYTTSIGGLKPAD